VRAAWWHEQQDEVLDSFLVEPQNQGRAGTTWEPSHEWRLAEATPSSRGLQWFTRKPLGYSTRRCGHPGRFNRPGGAVRPLGAGQIYRAGLTAQGGRSDRPGRRGRKACVEAKQVAVAGHPSDEDIPKISKSALEGHVSLVISEG
jgi:hypothetical protein